MIQLLHRTHYPKLNKFKHKSRLSYLVLFFLLALSQQVRAEGLKELLNGTSNNVITNFGKNSWASTGTSVNQRLNVFIKNPTSEVVYFGFNTSGDAYKIYDPNGNEVFSATTNNNGSISGEVLAGL